MCGGGGGDTVAIRSNIAGGKEGDGGGCSSRKQMGVLLMSCRDTVDNRIRM